MFEAGTTQRFRVLVVDEALPVLQSLQLLLSDDFDVTTASVPQTGLELSRTQRFDVICVDDKMTRMTGTGFLHEVMKQPDPPSCIVLSATPSPVNAQERIGTELVTVVGTPYDPAQLIRLIDQLARLCQVRRATAELGRRHLQR